MKVKIKMFLLAEVFFAILLWVLICVIWLEPNPLEWGWIGRLLAICIWQGMSLSFIKKE